MTAHDDSQRGVLPESWRVHLPIFEGPLDLLLHLVKVNQVEITDIPVALICDQFHEYLRLMEELDLDVAGEYIYEAAQLIQLKSRMLLPRPRSEDGGRCREDDPRAGSGAPAARVPAAEGRGAGARRGGPRAPGYLDAPGAALAAARRGGGASSTSARSRSTTWSARCARC